MCTKFNNYTNYSVLNQITEKIKTDWENHKRRKKESLKMKKEDKKKQQIINVNIFVPYLLTYRLFSLHRMLVIVKFITRENCRFIISLFMSITVLMAIVTYGMKGTVEKVRQK